MSGCTLVEGYGLSETSPVTHINPFGGPIKEGSIGLPVPATIMSLRQLGNPFQEVPLGEKGEICIAGPQVMKGYWKKPEETAASFAGEFFRTGDVAYMDSDGFTYIVDRIKDLIICSGFNVYPRRIEEAIYEHPGGRGGHRHWHSRRIPRRGAEGLCEACARATRRRQAKSWNS